MLQYPDSFKLTDKNQVLTQQKGAIRRLLGDLNITLAHGDTWVFPNHEKGDGILGTLSVSQFRDIPAIPGLVLHVTFGIEHLAIPGQQKLSKDGKITVTLKGLHLTGRSRKKQLTISEINAGSILDSQISFHRGPTNAWSYKEWEENRLKALAAELNMMAAAKEDIIAQLDAALTTYNNAYIERVGDEIAAQIKTTIFTRVRNQLTSLGLTPIAKEDVEMTVMWDQ